MDPTAPILWGIDPTVKFKWTPEEFRLPPIGWNERVTKLRPTEEALKVKEVADKYLEDLRALRREYIGVARPVKAGAPILYLKPLSERLSLRLQAASTLFERKLALARTWLDEDVKKIEDDANLSADQVEKAIREIDRAAAFDNEQRRREIFDEDLRFDVLAECVDGWENFRATWTGKWEKDAKAIPAKWKDEAFAAIRVGSVFTEDEQEGFTLPQESAAT